jgi:predicted PurR-regulated permease PerM
MALKRPSKPTPTPSEPGLAAYAPTAPQWLREAGINSWLVVGIGVVLLGLVWLMTLMQVIVAPVIVATVIAAVAGPVVSWLQAHRIPRFVGAILLLVAMIVLGIAVILIVVGGVTDQTNSLSGHLTEAKSTIDGWLTDLGIDTTTATDAVKQGSSGSSKSVSTLLHGISSGVKQLSSLAFFLVLTALSTLFLLIDGPSIRAWGERNMGIPMPLARTITQRSIESLRGYFLGVTIVAAFNAVVVSIGALLLGVPLVATIAIVTFLGAYVPYLGAWVAGAFSVLLALGGAGTDAAIGMIVVQILANGILQQMVQPFAMGAALGIHPLAVLIVTIGGGALFGAVGLILAAPIASAVTKILADVKQSQVDAATEQPASSAVSSRT